MIEHIALYRLKSEIERSQFAAQARIALASVSGLSGLSVGLPADAAAEKSWDVAIILRFRDSGALAQALASDAYQRCDRELLEPSAQVWKAWSFATIA